MTTKESVADAALLYFKTQRNLRQSTDATNSQEYRDLEALTHAAWDALKNKAKEYEDGLRNF